MTDQFKTIKTKTPEILFKDRGSKFYANAFPISSSNEVAAIITQLRKQHPKAGHHCYAYKIGTQNNNYRANDDGEPNHSAGDPILGQINSMELTDVLVVVSRIFGGTKLGVSGLINAYRESAKIALQEASIITKLITQPLIISFDYPQMSQVMRYIDEHKFAITDQQLTTTCKINIAVPISKIGTCIEELNSMFPIVAHAPEKN